MIKLIGLSDSEYDIITTHYFNLFYDYDENSNTVMIDHKRFNLEFYSDHIALDFPDDEVILTIMRCDFWRIEIE